MALLINNELAAELMNMQGCLEALESVFEEQGKGNAADRNKSSIHVPTEDPGLWYRYCSMEGASRRLRMVAIRIKSDMISWPEVNGRVGETKYTGTPGLYGVLSYYSVPGTVSSWRFSTTDSSSICESRAPMDWASSTLGEERRGPLGLIGSGSTARFNAEAYSLVRPLRRIKVFSTQPSHRNQFALR